MSTSLSTLLDTLNNAPENVTFDAVQAVIAEHYHYTPATFINGEGDDSVRNEAGTNEARARFLPSPNTSSFPMRRPWPASAIFTATMSWATRTAATTPTFAPSCATAWTWGCSTLPHWRQNSGLVDSAGWAPDAATKKPY